MEKIKRVHFPKIKENHYLWTVNSLPRCHGNGVAMATASFSKTFIPTLLILHQANFRYSEVRSFEIMFTNTCILENCVRPP